MNLLREYIRELLTEEQQRMIIKENIIQKVMGLVAKADQAIGKGVDDLIGPYFEKLNKWMEDNSKNIPGYCDKECVEKMKARIADVTQRAEEARAQWRKENPGEEPPWEKTILGMKASNWFPEWFPDPASKVWDEHLDE